MLPWLLVAVLAIAAVAGLVLFLLAEMGEM